MCTRLQWLRYKYDDYACHDGVQASNAYEVAHANETQCKQSRPKYSFSRILYTTTRIYTTTKSTDSECRWSERSCSFVADPHVTVRTNQADDVIYAATKSGKL